LNLSSPGDSGFAARCLLRAARAATLATQESGQPFASLVTPAVAPDGAVLLLLSGLATHTGHLLADPRCALMVTGAAQGPNPQTAPRVTVSGTAQRIDDAGLRRYWVQRHPYAALYADFTDFALWRLAPESGLFVGGFARAERLGRADLLPPEGAAGRIASVSAAAIAACNADQHALNRLAHARGASGDWLVLGVDTEGVDLMQDDSVLRVSFDAPAADEAGLRAALSNMLGL
jgi:putative heme iron utilization protein